MTTTSLFSQDFFARSRCMTCPNLLCLGYLSCFLCYAVLSQRQKRPKMDTFILSIHPQTTQQDSMHCWYTNASPGLEREREAGNLSPEADAGKIHSCYTCMISFPIYMRFSGCTYCAVRGEYSGNLFSRTRRSVV